MLLGGELLSDRVFLVPAPYRNAVAAPGGSERGLREIRVRTTSEQRAGLIPACCLGCLITEALGDIGSDHERLCEFQHPGALAGQADGQLGRVRGGSLMA